MRRQTRLGTKEVKLRKPYSLGSYNSVTREKQTVRCSQGCIHDCPFCYEPTELEIYPIPEIVRNQVDLIDMNLLCKPEALGIIEDLGERRVQGRVVYYEMICGIDYRFLTWDIAVALKKSRFRNIRLAWDWYLEDQRKLNHSIEMLENVGFRSEEMTVFMICNWRISYEENLKKLELCKVWRVKVADCYWDGQVSPKIIPEFWTHEEIRDFRSRVRRHNKIVRFKIDPEMKT